MYRPYVHDALTSHNHFALMCRVGKRPASPHLPPLALSHVSAYSPPCCIPAIPPPPLHSAPLADIPPPPETPNPSLCRPYHAHAFGGCSTSLLPIFPPPSVPHCCLLTLPAPNPAPSQAWLPSASRVRHSAASVIPQARRCRSSAATHCSTATAPPPTPRGLHDLGEAAQHPPPLQGLPQGRGHHSSPEGEPTSGHLLARPPPDSCFENSQILKV